MAKNKAQELVDRFNNLVVAAGGGDDPEMSRMPLTPGDVITLTGETTMQKSTSPGIPDWLAFDTKEGYPIGFRQLFRRGNGLIFPENVKTIKEAAKALIDKICTFDDGLRLQLKDIRKVESSSRRGKNTYYIFEEYTI